MIGITDDTKTFTIALTSLEVPAKGSIVNLTYPASVEHGKPFDVNASAKNIGTVPGIFKMLLFINGSLISTSQEFVLSGGATSSDKIPMTNAPTSGNSMTIVVKCNRLPE